MISLATLGVEVAVAAEYVANYSNQRQGQYFFSYRITIENTNSFDVQLISRHWKIFDSLGIWRDVEGEGVIGKQPRFSEDESYSYNSGCVLHSGMGRMHGTYTFRRVHDGTLFKVLIPRFDLVAPFKFN